jgi:hypothetical protein
MHHLRRPIVTALLALWTIVAAAGDQIEIILQDAVTDTSDLLAAQIDELHVRAVAGSSPVARFYAGYVCELAPGDRGIQGWAIAGALEGDVTLLGASSREIVDALRHGRAPRSASFEVTHLIDSSRIDPRTGDPQGQGFVSAVVLGMTRTLVPRGTSSVVELTVGAEAADGEGEGEEVTGRLIWRDGLVGEGLPVENIVTIDGQSRRPSACQELPIRFTSFVPLAFIRCDSNEDGRVDLADAVTILERLFRNGNPRDCRAASDCDADGEIVITDAIRVIEYLFLGGSPPPDPFPLCGDPTSELDDCRGATSFCRH